MAQHEHVGNIGFGTTITFNSFTADVISITGPGLQRAAVKMGHLESPNNWEEYMPGRKDAGEITVDVNFQPGLTPPIAGAVGAVVITWPSGGTLGAGGTWTCDGFVTAYEPTTPADDRMNASITIKLTGEPTFA